MIPKCKYHSAVQMIPVKGTRQKFYGKHKTPTSQHYRCPVSGCVFFATVELGELKHKYKSGRVRLVFVGLIH